MSLAVGPGLGKRTGGVSGAVAGCVVLDECHKRDFPSFEIRTHQTPPLPLKRRELIWDGDLQSP